MYNTANKTGYTEVKKYFQKNGSGRSTVILFLSFLKDRQEAERFLKCLLHNARDSKVPFLSLFCSCSHNHTEGEDLFALQCRHVSLTKPYD